MAGAMAGRPSGLDRLSRPLEHVRLDTRVVWVLPEHLVADVNRLYVLFRLEIVEGELVADGGGGLVFIAPRLLVVPRRILVRGLLLLDDSQKLPRLRTRLVRREAPPAELFGEVVLAADDVDVREDEPAAFEVVDEVRLEGELGDALQVVASLGRLLEHEVRLREAHERRQVVLLHAQQLEEHGDGTVDRVALLARHQHVTREYFAPWRRRQFS
mmetsp:Transcript_38713/g.102101  ORF Transcript_38713/g.102101 Transcript_38713/m.102101 type:complete len:214 (-) Transcript_38713:443-1084(-)